jgi:hypothetical protein
MRITLSPDEIEAIKANKLPTTLLSKVLHEENKPASKKLTKGAANARAVRTKATKAKIASAINILSFENKKISVYSVAKEAKVSFNTVNKDEELKKMISSMEEARVKSNIKPKKEDV